jgi:hypothetical protein
LCFLLFQRILSIFGFLFFISHQIISLLIKLKSLMHHNRSKPLVISKSSCSSRTLFNINTNMILRIICNLTIKICMTIRAKPSPLSSLSTTMNLRNQSNNVTRQFYWYGLVSCIGRWHIHYNTKQGLSAKELNSSYLIPIPRKF